MKSIAFLFLIYDIINAEKLWYDFFKNVDKSKYTIYIHYKKNVTLKYFNDYKLDKCLQTKWGDMSLVWAQNLLLKHALENTNNQHFIFISNSCIPLKNFDHIYNELNPDYSYFNILINNPSTQNIYKSHIFNDINIKIASQWSILNKKHSNILLENKDLFNCFKHRSLIPDEMCYINILLKKCSINELKLTYRKNIDNKTKICNILNKTLYANTSVLKNKNYPQILNAGTTFVNWRSMEYKYQSVEKIKNYDLITQNELQYLLNSNCLFARKFTLKCIPYLNKQFYIHKISN